MPTVSRPTSPHLTIYRKQITSVLSISHRLTGLWLFAGLGLVVVWLCILAYRPDLYSRWYGFLNSPVGLCALAAWTFSFYYHLSNGVRHLFWDMGKGFAIPQVESSGWAVIFFSAAMTAATWGIAHGLIGG